METTDTQRATTNALIELTQERGYRDATELLKAWYQANGDEYNYFCTLQAPDGSPVYCRTSQKLLRVLETARANNQTNETRTAREPIDSPPWTLVSNFDVDDEDDEVVQEGE